jgi:hypothetical protein
MAAFQQGYSLEASVNGDVLAVPVIVDRPPIVERVAVGGSGR